MDGLDERVENPEVPWKVDGRLKVIWRSFRVWPAVKMASPTRATVNASLAVARMQSQQATPQFYRRALPSSCVDFSSEEGKKLFVGALNEGKIGLDCGPGEVGVGLPSTPGLWTGELPYVGPGWLQTHVLKGLAVSGNANIYFKLAAQFLTQEEPSFCGLSTLGKRSFL